MNKAIILVDLMLKELGFEKYYELADFFGVTAASISGWVNRNSTKAAFKHAARKGMDINSLQKKLDEAEKDQNNSSSPVAPKNAEIKKEEPKQKNLFEDEAYKKREEMRARIRAQVEQQQKERLENYVEVISLLSATKNGFSKEFQYAFWRRFEEIKEEIFEGYESGYYDNSSPERTWDDTKNDKIDAEFEKLLQKVIDKDNLLIFKSWTENLEE